MPKLIEEFALNLKKGGWEATLTGPVIVMTYKKGQRGNSLGKKRSGRCARFLNRFDLLEL